MRRRALRAHVTGAKQTTQTGGAVPGAGGAGGAGRERYGTGHGALAYSTIVTKRNALRSWVLCCGENKHANGIAALRPLASTYAALQIRVHVQQRLITIPQTRMRAQRRLFPVKALAETAIMPVHKRV